MAGMFFIARSRPAKAYSYDEAVSTKGGADSVETNGIGDAVNLEEGNRVDREELPRHESDAEERRPD